MSEVIQVQDTETVIVIRESTESVEVSTPGVPGPPGIGVPTGGTTGQQLAKNSNADYDTEWVSPASNPDAEDVAFTPAGTIASTDVQAAIEEVASEYVSLVAGLSAVYQVLDSDLTAIAALATTSFGRNLLLLADQAALLSAAGAAAAVHTHAESDVTGLTTDLAGKQPLDSDLTAIAGLSPTNDDLVQRKAGAWTNRTMAQLIADLAALGTTFQPLDSDLTAIAALTTTSFGRSLLALADAAATRAALDLEPGTDFPSLSTFNDHSDRHEEGSADQINVTVGQMDAELSTDGQVPTSDGLGGVTWEDQSGSGSVAADDVSVDSTTLSGTGVNVQASLEELDNLLDDHSARHENGGADEISIAGLDGTPTELTNHLNDTGDAHDASAISSVAAGNLSSTDVQAALNELDTEKQPIDSDLTTIAALSPTDDDLVQRKAGAWTNRSIAQLLVDLAAAGTTFQPLDSDLTALAGLAVAADTLPYGTGSHTMALATFTSFARQILDDADASTVLSTLGVTTFIKTLLDDADAATARGTLAAAPKAATYIVQTADSELSAEQALGALATGMLKNTTTTGVLSIGTEGTDYYKPTGTDVALADGGTGASLVDPNADRILFWDDSAGAVTWLAPGTGLTITTTTIDASGGSASTDYVPSFLFMGA